MCSEARGDEMEDNNGSSWYNFPLSHVGIDWASRSPNRLNGMTGRTARRLQHSIELIDSTEEISLQHLTSSLGGVSSK